MERNVDLLRELNSNVAKAQELYEEAGGGFEFRDAEEGLMRGGAEPPSASDRRTFGNTSASGSREGGLVDEAWRDAEARSRVGEF